MFGGHATIEFFSKVRPSCVPDDTGKKRRGVKRRQKGEREGLESSPC